MKKHLLALAICAMSAYQCAAQKVWAVPAVSLPDEEVTWYVDLSEYMQTEGEDMYIWTWAPSNPEELAGKTDGWDNPSEFSHMKYEGDGVYSITLVPTEYYQTTVEACFANDDIFWFNVRARRNGVIADPTGSLHAPRPFNLEFQEFLKSGADVKVYPTSFTYKDNISILVNIENLAVGGVKGALVGQSFGDLFFHSGLNEWDGTHDVNADMGDAVLKEKTKLKKVYENIYKLDMCPKDYYNITDEDIDGGYQVNDITGQFPTTDWKYLALKEDGSPWKFLFAGVDPDPDPVFSYFPTKFSQLDFLTLTRQYDNGAANLEYSVTGGNTTLKGEFGGSRAKRVAVINLFDGFKNEPGLAKIHVTVTRLGNGATIEDFDLPLITTAEIE